MPQLFHILPIFLPLAGQVLGQNRYLVIATKGEIERILWKNLKIDLKIQLLSGTNSVGV